MAFNVLPLKNVLLDDGDEYSSQFSNPSNHCTELSLQKRAPFVENAKLRRGEECSLRIKI